MNRMDKTIREILSDLNIKCKYHNDSNDCKGCVFCYNSNNEFSCGQFLIKTPWKFLDILYPKTIDEEVHEYFPKMKLDDLCVCDILGLEFKDEICSRYDSCEAHHKLSKEELLKEAGEDVVY